MTSPKPYLIRAFYEWMIDNEESPQLEVNTRKEGLNIPKHLMQNEQIVLNVSPKAVRNLHLTNQAVEFEATFKGVPGELFVPVPAILAIYAKEDGRGMVFEEETEDDPPPVVVEPSKKSNPIKKGKPNLKVVK